MAGHSKWANIKHKKAAADAKRGKVFSKIAREIMVVAREGGGDPSANVTLRGLIQKARSVNMPADNIDRAVKKGTGELEGAALEEFFYEGYAADGVALLIHILSDNRNRTSGEVKHAFSKHNANMAGAGAVARSFNRKGVITVSDEVTTEDKLMEVTLEAGAEDLEHEDGVFTVTTDPSIFGDVVDAITEAGIDIQNSEITMLPELYVQVTDVGTARSIMNFIDALDDLDDVQNVYSNLDVDDEVLAALEEE